MHFYKPCKILYADYHLNPPQQVYNIKAQVGTKCGFHWYCIPLYVFVSISSKDSALSHLPSLQLLPTLWLTLNILYPQLTRIRSRLVLGELNNSHFTSSCGRIAFCRSPTPSPLPLNIYIKINTHTTRMVQWKTQMLSLLHFIHIIIDPSRPSPSAQ